MKKITLLIFAIIATAGLRAQETCTADGTKVYYTTNAGWSNSEWYKIIDIDAETLGASGMVKHTGADGSATSTAWNSGAFTTPVYKYVESSSSYVPTSVLWPVKYYLCCINDTAHSSSWTKVSQSRTTSASGAADAPCYNNNNSVKTSPIWDKKGFIELSRQAADVAAPAVSRHGYIQIDSLPQVERIQWSYSSTGWKRGVKMDINYNDGTGWQQLRWIASDAASSIGSFSEQGYAFEELINKQEDATSKISLRWRIWDGDTTTVNPTKTDGSKFNYAIAPLAQKQVIRIHQIKIYSGVEPTSAPTLPNGIELPVINSINIFRNGNQIILSEDANYELYTYDGKQVKTGFDKKIDISGISKGIYIIKATNESGRTMKKIII